MSPGLRSWALITRASGTPAEPPAHYRSGVSQCSAASLGQRLPLVTTSEACRPRRYPDHAAPLPTFATDPLLHEGTPTPGHELDYRANIGLPDCRAPSRGCKGEYVASQET